MLAARSQNTYSAQHTLRQGQQPGTAAAGTGAGPGTSLPGCSPRHPAPGQGCQQGSPRHLATATPDRLLTDRTSYISYLESQLERVSAACLTVASFDERLEAVTGAVRLLEEKVLNVARLVHCTQQYAEQQEEAARAGLEGLGRRVAALEARAEGAAEAQRALGERVAALGPEVDARLQAAADSSAQQLAAAADKLRAGLGEACHEAHLSLETRLGEATGRVGELERKLRALDEYAHANNATAQAASLAARLGGVEDSLGHLAQVSSGLQRCLTGVEQGMAQLRTAVVALELRPPLDGSLQGGPDTLQWLARAREALEREVSAVLQQSQQVATGISAAAAAAEAAPPSPQKAMASQVLAGMQGALHEDLGREVAALHLADRFMAGMAQQLEQQLSPRPPLAQHAQRHGCGGPGAMPAAATAAAAVAEVVAGAAASAAAPGLVAGKHQGQVAAPQAGGGGPARGQAPAAMALAKQQGQQLEPSGWTIPTVPATAMGPPRSTAAQSQQTVESAAGAASAGGSSLLCPPAAGPQQQQQPAWAQPAGMNCFPDGHSLLRVTVPQAAPAHAPAHAPAACLQQQQQQQQPYGQSQPCSPSWRPPAAAFPAVPASAQCAAATVSPVLHQLGPPISGQQQHLGDGLAAEGAAASPGGLRASLGQMQGMLHSVCKLLGVEQQQQQQQEGGEQHHANGAGLTAIPSSRQLARTTTLGWAGTQPKRAWLPGGSGGAASRSTSLKQQPTLATSQAQRVAEERRLRLQQLYAELRQG